MTREEALAVLQKIKPTPCRADGKSTTHTLATIALDMAIKALEQQPCGDCISRNAIIETLNEMDRFVANELTLCRNNNKFPQNEVFIVDDVYEQIAEELPSVEPERKKGKWIWDKRTGTYHCSECGHDPLHEDVGEIEEYKYCMNCGAEMEVDG